MKKFLSVLAILALDISSAAAQNALKNSGFEELTITSGSSIGKWFRFSSGAMGAASESITGPHSGAKHIALETGAANQFAGVFQTLENPSVPGSARPVTPGSTVRFTGWHGAVGSSNQTSEIKLEWQGSPTPPQSRLDVVNVPVGAYVQFMHTGVAPVGTTGLRVSYAISTFGAGQNGFTLVHIDDFQTFIARVPGDYNNNDQVDAADYVVWRKNLGTATLLPNDLDGGTIGTAQYNTWRVNFGKTFSGSASIFTAPEPSALALLVLGAWVPVSGRPRKPASHNRV